MTNKSLIASLILGVLAVSCGQSEDASMLGQKKAERDSLKAEIASIAEKVSSLNKWIEQNDTNQLNKLTLVTTVQFEKQSYAHHVEVHGTVKAYQNAMLYSTMGGEVKRILVEQGVKVNKGQLLVDIEASALRQNISQVKAQLDLAADVAQRQERLWNDKVGSEIQYLEAQTNKEAMAAQLASLQQQLRTSQIYAPFSGVVDEVFPNVGDMATPMQPVLRLVALGKASIESDVAETYLGKLHVGDPVEVHIGEMDTTISAHIDQIGNYINPANRTFKVSLRLNEHVQLRPNQLATVRVRDIAKDNATVLQPRLIMEDSEGRSYVYVANGNGDIAEVKKVFVERILSGADMVLVKDTDELKSGVQIIDQGSRLVVAEQRIRTRQGA